MDYPFTAIPVDMLAVTGKAMTDLFLEFKRLHPLDYSNCQFPLLWFNIFGILYSKWSQNKIAKRSVFIIIVWRQRMSKPLAPKLKKSLLTHPRSRNMSGSQSSKPFRSGSNSLHSSSSADANNQLLSAQYHTFKNL